MNSLSEASITLIPKVTKNNKETKPKVNFHEEQRLKTFH